MPRLSAGRVQSVATRLVVERERERMRVRRGRLLGHPRHVRAGLVRGATLERRRQARRAGPGLRRDGSTDVSRRPRARRGRRAIARGRTLRTAVHRREGRREALHAATGRAVPHVHAAAGGEPQAALLVADDDARRPAPLRERPHHVHANRLGDAVRLRARRRRARTRHASTGQRHGARRAATLRAGGRERAGSARGDPARRGRLPDAGRAPRRALSRRARALRPHLQADGRVPDEGRERSDRLDRAGRDDGRRPRGDLPRERHRDHVSRAS